MFAPSRSNRVSLLGEFPRNEFLRSVHSRSHNAAAPITARFASLAVAHCPMPQSHTLPIPVSLGVDSQACWAFKPTGHIILFVHGFNGHATRTWMDFPGLIGAEPRFHGCDLVFFGYKSRARADDCAGALIEFIDALIDPGLKIVNSSLSEAAYPPRDKATFAWKRLTIVAHSLGANIARRALIFDTFNRTRKWTLPTDLVLFAPAHKGAKLLELVLETALGIDFGGIGGSILQNVVPAFEDLQKGSNFLRDLENDTKAGVDRGDIHLRASIVLAADPDRVVTNTTFARDPLAKKMYHTSHISVCKPRRGYRRPVLELTQLP